MEGSATPEELLPRSGVRLWDPGSRGSAGGEGAGATEGSALAALTDLRTEAGTAAEGSAVIGGGEHLMPKAVKLTVEG